MPEPLTSRAPAFAAGRQGPLLVQAPGAKKHRPRTKRYGQSMGGSAGSCEIPRRVVAYLPDPISRTTPNAVHTPCHATTSFLSVLPRTRAHATPSYATCAPRASASLRARRATSPRSPMTVSRKPTPARSGDESRLGAGVSSCRPNAQLRMCVAYAASGDGRRTMPLTVGGGVGQEFAGLESRLLYLPR